MPANDGQIELAERRKRRSGCADPEISRAAWLRKMRELYRRERREFYRQTRRNFGFLGTETAAAKTTVIKMLRPAPLSAGEASGEGWTSAASGEGAESIG